MLGKVLVKFFEVHQKCSSKFYRDLSYSQAEPGRELTQPSPRLLAQPRETMLERRTQKSRLS